MLHVASRGIASGRFLANRCLIARVPEEVVDVCGMQPVVSLVLPAKGAPRVSGQWSGVGVGDGIVTATGDAAS